MVADVRVVMRRRIIEGQRLIRAEPELDDLAASGCIFVFVRSVPELGFDDGSGGDVGSGLTAPASGQRRIAGLDKLNPDIRVEHPHDHQSSRFSETPCSGR